MCTLLSPPLCTPDNICHGRAGVPGLATRCLCVLSTWLVVFCGAICSSVYCLSPPILLPHHCFSSSTCVPLVTLVYLTIYPPGVWSPVLIRCLLSCVCYVDCYSSLPACLFFPFGVVFVHFCFILWLKRNHSLVLEYLISLLMRPDRTDQPDEDSAESATGNHGSRAEVSQRLPGRQEHWGIRQGLRGSGSPVGYGKGLPHGLFLGRPSRALQVPYTLSAPWGVTGGVHQPGSEFKQLSLQGGVSCGASSFPWAHRVRSRARSVPWAHRARSVLGAHRVRPVSWAHRVHSRSLSSCTLTTSSCDLDELVDGILEDLFPDLDKNTSELLDSLWCYIATLDVLIHNAPEVLNGLRSGQHEGQSMASMPSSFRNCLHTLTT